MAKVYEGKLIGQGLRFGIVVSRFNEFITGKLLSGAQDALNRHGVSEDAVEIAWVPGAFEIPLVADRMAASGRYDAVIALGAVIRGRRPILTTWPVKWPRGCPAPPSKTACRSSSE